MILVIGYWFLIISYNQQPATSNKMTIKHQLGLIGYPLSHSFSKKYFAEKFQEEKILIEVTGRKRNKIYVFDELMKIIR